MTEEDIFALAVGKGLEDRTAYLDEACGTDADLRAGVERRLHAAGSTGTFSERTTTHAPDDRTASLDSGGSASLSASDAERPGQVLAGRYRLIEPIGEGGMGSVYLARQAEPVRRDVAVKVIKAGMDSRAVLARFDAERQALAMMDHPNIAKVLDAGATAEGHPYFVMELVKGVPITRFCDDRKLTPRQRLELFIPVCEAIQHAHQKGVIHRDIKPSNVLVGLYDDRPIPKVIDFGVAKATEAPLTDHSMMTGHGALIGTPEYMSPEQASLDGLDIDTRSDVYALGVLLYELLTGTTPVDRKSLGRAALTEILRVVREVEPPRPSAKLSFLDALPSVAASRGVEPARLCGLLRGELDWIAMKALEKDRSRRYDSANGLARDVRRYLDDEVVEARPPSAGYRMRKFVRRHKGQVAAGTLVFASLLAGIVGTTWGLVRAEKRRVEAEEANKVASARLKLVERGNAMLTGLFEDLDMRQTREEKTPLEVVLSDRMAKVGEQLEVESAGDPAQLASMQERLGRSLMHLGSVPQAVRLLEKSRASRLAMLGPEHADTIESTNALASAYVAAGQPERALPLLEGALLLQEKTLAPDDEKILSTMMNLGETSRIVGRMDRAVTLLEGAAKATKAKGVVDAQSINAMNSLGETYRAVGRFQEALPLHEEAYRLMKEKYGPNHHDTLQFMNNLGCDYLDLHHPADALPLLMECLRLTKERLGPDNPEIIQSINNLSNAYQDLGRLDEALPLSEEAMRLAKAKLGPDHQNTLIAMHNLGSMYGDLGQFDRAVSTFEEALRFQKAKFGPDHPNYFEYVGSLGKAYDQAGRPADSLRLLEENYRAPRKGPAPPALITPLIEGYLKAGRTAEALAIAKEALAAARKSSPAGSPQLAGALNFFGSVYLRAKDYADAEPLLRESLAIREKAEPDLWSTFNTRSVLGGALLGQKRYDEAGPLLVEGYGGMKAREKTMPQPALVRVPEAADRLIEFYTATNKPEEAAKWKAERAKYDQPPPAKPEEKK